MSQLSTIDDSIIIKFEEPFLKVQQINNYSDDASGETVNKYFLKEFRWSIDDLTYGGWKLLDQTNLQELTLNPDNKFWIQYRYTVTGSSGPEILEINTVTLDVTYKESPKYKGYSPNKCLCEKDTSSFVINPNCIPFNPYNVNGAVNINKDLNLIINRTFGIDVQYFKCTPQARSKDVVLKEYGILLQGMDTAKCIKVIVPNNEFPDAKPSYSEFGVDFERPFEIQIDKRYFESFYGSGAQPQRKDVLLIPMTDRIYEVSGSYLFRGIMNEELYFIVSLVKWKNSSNVIQDAELQEGFDKIALNVDKLFKEEIEEEILINSKPEQYTIITSEQDPTRQMIHKQIVLNTEQIMNNYTLVSNYNYKLNSLIGISDTAVKYHALNKWESIENRSFTCWFQRTEVAQAPNKYITSIINNGNNTFTATLNTTHNWTLNSEIMLALPNLNEVTTTNIITVDSPTSITFGWSLTNILPNVGWYVYQSYSNVLLESKASNNDFIISQPGNKSFSIDLGIKRYMFNLPFNLQSDKWYSLVINMSNIHKEISLYLWEIDPTVKSTKLKILYSLTKTLETVELNGPQFELVPGNLKLTNIRLFRDIIEPEKQGFILNQAIVKDSHLSIITDNALPVLKLPVATKKY